MYHRYLAHCLSSNYITQRRAYIPWSTSQQRHAQLYRHHMCIQHALAYSALRGIIKLNWNGSNRERARNKQPKHAKYMHARTSLPAGFGR